MTNTGVKAAAAAASPNPNGRAASVPKASDPGISKELRDKADALKAISGFGPLGLDVLVQDVQKISAGGTHVSNDDVLKVMTEAKKFVDVDSVNNEVIAK